MEVKATRIIVSFRWKTMKTFHSHPAQDRTGTVTTSIGSSSSFCEKHANYWDKWVQEEILLAFVCIAGA